MTATTTTHTVSKTEVPGTRTVIGKVERVTYTVVVEETTIDDEIVEPVPDPVPTPVTSFLKADMSQATFLYGHDPKPTGSGPHWSRSLSIDGVDDDAYQPPAPKPASFSGKHMMNREAVGIEATPRGARMWAKGRPGQSIGARIMLNPKVYLDDNTPGTVLHACCVYDRPDWNLDWKAGTFVSAMQAKIQYDGPALFRMNVELPWYDSSAPQVPRLYWDVNASQGIKLERQTRVPFPVGINVLDLVWDMKPAGGSLLAKFNGVETAYFTGRLADDNGDVWFYPAILYGDKWREGVLNEFFLKTVELSTEPIA